MFYDAMIVVSQECFIIYIREASNTFASVQMQINCRQFLLDQIKHAVVVISIYYGMHGISHFNVTIR